MVCMCRRGSDDRVKFKLILSIIRKVIYMTLNVVVVVRRAGLSTADLLGFSHIVVF